jgi:putative ABC transport system permease protein
MYAVDLGFNPDGLITMEVLPLERTPAAHKEYYKSLLQQIRTLPGITQVGLVDNFPLGSGMSFTSVSVAGKETFLTVFATTPGYFETIGARLRAGRFPNDADYGAGLRAVVINESAARMLFPDGRVVGAEMSRAGGDRRPWTVLGVIADLRHGGPLETAPRPQNQAHVFFPLEPTASDLTEAMLIVMRISPDAPVLADQLRRVARSIGPPVLVERIRTGEELLGQSVITPRRRTVLLALLGSLGLILALVGVFGMTAYAVTRRTAEIGVRMAFGARPGQVVGRILRDAALPILIGTAVGVVAATFATKAIASFLFQTAPTDPVTFAVVALTLIATGGGAALLPALRAAQVDPASCLRSE